MSWLSDFLGTKKLRTPKVKQAEELADMDEFESEAYLRELSRKSGFEKTIITGRKRPKLATPSILG